MLHLSRAAPNGSCLYLYLPNWHLQRLLGKMILHLAAGYDTQSWHLWVTGIVCYWGFGNISFNIGPLCTGHISTWFNWAGSKHSLTLLLALGTNTQLLHHSSISSTPRGVIISCYCSLCSSSWNGFCSAYATHHGGAWYVLLFAFSYKEYVPSKLPMPLKTSSNSVCICCVNSALFLLSLLQLGPARKEVCWFIWISFDH